MPIKRRRSTKHKLKKVSYELIERHSDAGRKLHFIVNELVEAYHDDLRDARIALAWNLSWQPDVDGRVILGKCRKASDLDRELVAYDFVIILRKEFFENPTVTDQQRRALLDHELCHGALTFDARGEPLEDERGRKVYRIRRHDLEEFSAIAERYGCWKKDLEAFATALEKANLSTERQYIGCQRLHQSLENFGYRIPLETIVAWTERERRDAMKWTLLRQDLGRNDIIPPPHVTEAATTTH
jgi:hypothetical protein